MSPQTKLEIKGNLNEHPLAELLVEITEANLSGSFRLSKDDEKVIIYLNEGKVVFAVSNLRQHRLFSIALEESIITKDQLLTLSNVANDMELSANLTAQNLVSQEDVTNLVVKQIEEIIKFCLAWNEGEWIFSSLARIKESINFEIDLNEILMEYSRNLSSDEILKHFTSEESFGIKPDSPFHINLHSHEAFILSRFENEFLTLNEIDTISGLPENATRQILYSLWFGGFLFRQNWNCVLSENKIADILSAKLQRVEETKTTEPLDTSKEDLPIESAETEIVEELDEETLLLNYLDRVENTITLYEIIGVETEAETAEIKKAYFSQAKKYHPDLFHKNEEFHTRTQNAFTKLAHAYETLKSNESRELYDYKMRKELADIKEREKSGATVEESNLNKQAEKAAENFEWGLTLLQENEFQEAIPFFTRAVHFDENNARFHAFYGKALSFDKKNLHKAEAEIQTAIKLEPEIVAYRLMLIELFIHIGLKKRAEGELNRLLAIAPNDRDALALLDSLQNK